MKKYYGIDLIKFIMAICVVAIHIHPIGEENAIYDIYKAFINLAVPFFFVASGFLLGVKMDCLDSFSEKNKTIMKKYTKRIIIMYVIWSVVYLPLAIYDYINNGNSVIDNFVLYIRGFFLVGEHFNSWILWYLLSAIYGIILIRILYKFKIDFKKILIIGIGLFLLGYSVDWIQTQDISWISPLKEFLVFAIPSGRIFNGFLLIAFGIYISKIKINENKLVLIGLLIVMFIIDVISDGLIERISCILCAITLFELSKLIQLKESKVWIILRKFSVDIYFLHLLIWSIYSYLIYHEIVFGGKSFIITLVLCIMVSFMHYTVKNKIEKIKSEKKVSLLP